MSQQEQAELHVCNSKGAPGLGLLRKWGNSGKVLVWIFVRGFGAALKFTQCLLGQDQGQAQGHG